METGLILPPGFDRDVAVLPSGPQHGTVVNETDLPDDMVMAAVETYFEDHASVLGVARGSSFSSYSNEGSLLARSKFQVPQTVFEEIVLARDIAERDDDIASTIGCMLALAFGEGMMHTHEDEVTVSLFDKIARHTNLDLALQEMYRELLISSQFTTVALFTLQDLSIKPQGADRSRTRQIVAPLIGVLPSEQIRVLDDDTFRTGTLAYRPATGSQETWLREFFAPYTSPGRKAEMRRENPVLTSLLIEQRQLPVHEDPRLLTPESLRDPAHGNDVYVLNPRMVDRSTFPKGAAKYPRPLMTRDFSLLEAKRLLNIMDHALLQGGSNFLVVAKKGDKDRPALPGEITNLREVIKRASATGVIIGDHRLSIEIITPDLESLLNAEKRGLLGRKLAQALLRLPEFSESDGTQEVLTNTEIVSRVITADRRLVRRHVENNVYEDVVERNPTQFLGGPAGIWFPKIVLQGLQYFSDLVLKLRDRGDISRRSAVQAGGFDYESEVQARKREKPDDKVMTPAAVPFAGQQDPQGGRPRGGSSANGAPGSQPRRSTNDPARPRRVIQRNRGETVRAIQEEDLGIVRTGELTYAILEEYDGGAVGRITPTEQAALDRIASGDYEPARDGTLFVFPVNGEYTIDHVRAVRLGEGVSMLVGNRVGDDAVVAQALCFRQPQFSAVDAQAAALGWGYDCNPLVGPDPDPELET